MTSKRKASNDLTHQHHNKEVKEDHDWFASIPSIKYDPKAAVDNQLVFRQYHADEVILGRPMHEWLRFSVCYWHTFRGMGQDMFGAATHTRPWEDGTDSLSNALTRLRVAFQFFSKLGVKFWTFHDRDIAPEGATWEETQSNLNAVVDLAVQLQKQTGIKCLWGTANLFSAPRYMNGAATNPDAHVVAYAAAQVKHAIDVTHKLGGENYVFWGGREGYQSILNTNVKAELDHMAAFFHMCVTYKKKIGFKGTFLIEPKPKEPTKHQYDYDAQTVIGFLHTYGLQHEFKLNIEPNHTTLAGHSYEHDIIVAAKYGMLGSVDANTGDQSLGWDTDQFPMDIRNATLVMKAIVEMGGLGTGGLNFDCKVRRESSDIEDLFIAHIGAMDTFARGLRAAAAIINDKHLDRLVSARYASFQTGIGAQIAAGKATLEECETFVKKEGEPKQTSGKQEKCEALFNQYL